MQYIQKMKDIIGKTCILPIMNKEIPIIADDFVEKDFGTGCVNVTPFGTQTSKHMKLKRFGKLITNYFNEYREELIAC